MHKKALKVLYVFNLIGFILLPACAEIKETGRTIGHTSRDVTREIGHGTRTVAIAIGHKSRDIAHDIGAGSRKVVRAMVDTN